MRWVVKDGWSGRVWEDAHVSGRIRCMIAAAATCDMYSATFRVACVSRCMRCFLMHKVGLFAHVWSVVMLCS